MKKVLSCFGAITLVSTLGACGSTDAPANEAEANGATEMMADSEPFGDTEMRMNKAIVKAVGVNAGDSWVRKMIEHHKGAVEMSRIVLTRNPTAAVGTMAQQTIDKQTKEIAALEKLVATGNPDPASGELYRPAAMQMRSAMMAASGANISDTYLRKMLAHHQGAVAMADVALANGATGAIRAQVEKTRAEQKKEADMVEAMLRGEPMGDMTAPAADRPTASPTASTSAPRPTTQAKPAPPPAKPKPAEPAPDPHAGMDMNNMQR